MNEEKPSTALYTFVGVVPEDVADGRVVSSGASVEIDPADPHNAGMIERGVLIPTPPAKKEAKPSVASTPEEEGSGDASAAPSDEAPAAGRRGRNKTSEEGSK
jgi:hypothetical protein